MTKISPSDLFGQALQDYLHNREPAKLFSHSSLAVREEVPLEYLFRTYEQMPLLEQIALDHAIGHILDAGCGSGSHSLYLQSKGSEVTGLDSSAGAIKTARERGVKNLICENINALEVGVFDTILLLMNGSGLAGSLENLPAFLMRLKGFLAPRGQILIDSSDLSYLFEDGDGLLVPGEKAYYGELDFCWEYKNQISGWFPWLYVDYEQLQIAAQTADLDCNLLAEGSHYDYLAKLSPPQ